MGEAWQSKQQQQKKVELMSIRKEKTFFAMFFKIKDDFKLDDLTKIIMPMSYFSPWLFEAIYQLPYNYQSGKLIAYKTLSHVVIRSAQVYLLQVNNDFDSISDEFMDLFYITIHQGLRSNDKVSR
jgi:hypothetical protein